MKLYGWICPLCKKVWAPHMQQCDCQDRPVTVSTNPISVPPGLVSQDPTAWEREQIRRAEEASIGIPPNTEVMIED